jgi:ribosomal protein L1
MRTVDVQEAKENLSKLIETAERGQEVIISKFQKTLDKPYSLKTHELCKSERRVSHSIVLRLLS